MASGIYPPTNPQRIARNLDLVIDVKRDFGAAGSNQSTTGSITAGSTVLTVASAIDLQVGQGISVAGAGTSGGLLVSTIQAISGTTITLLDAASTTVTNAAVNHDDTTAIQQAVNIGHNVFLPEGTYPVTGTISLQPNQVISGAAPRTPDSSAGGTVVMPMSDFGHVFYVSNASGAEINNLSIFYSGITMSSASTPSTHAAIYYDPYHSVQRCRVQNVNIMGMGQGIVMPYYTNLGATSAVFTYFVFSTILIYSCNVGVIAMTFSDSVFTDIRCNNLFGYDIASLYPYCCPVNASATASPTYSSPSQNLIADLGNSHLYDFSVYGGKGDGLVLEDVVQLKVDRAVVASTSGNGLTLVGMGADMLITALRSALNAGNGVYITTSSNSVAGVKFYGCRIESNGLAGVKGSPGTGQAINKLYLRDCMIQGNSTSSVGGYSGIDLQASEWAVLGGRIHGANQAYGVFANYTGVSASIIDGVDFSQGNYTAALLIPGATPPNRAVNNAGYNPVGYLSNAPAVPASGTAQANNFSFPVRVYVSGGTVSALALNGTATGLTSGEVLLAPGDTITLTYTAAPSWVWFGL